MRRCIWIISMFMMCGGNALAREETNSKSCPPKAQSSDYDSRETTVISMMGWGVGLFAGIAILCSLMKNNPEKK